MPFGLYPQGGVMVTEDPNLQTQQHIESLITTQPGERVMLPKYGVNSGRYVFSPNDQTISAILVNDVTTALNNWEPSVNVLAIRPTPNSSIYGIANIEVDFSQGTTALLAQTFTATILVGGSVIGDPIA
jgi:Bacteriophage baseplate protein W